MLFEKRIELAEEKLTKMWANNSYTNENGTLVLHIHMKDGSTCTTWNIRKAGGKPCRVYRDSRSGMICEVGTMRGLAIALLNRG